MKRGILIIILVILGIVCCLQPCNAQQTGGYKSVSAGYWHIMVLKNDGSLWGWGANGTGQIGDGTNSDRSSAVKILDNVQSMSTGSSHTFAIKNDGTLWGWGWNSCGQLGDGTTIDRNRPVMVLDNVCQVATGISYTLALKNDGTLWGWGCNEYGQLGSQNSGSVPKKILDDVKQVSACEFHVFGI